jgi:hypothetical protein
MVILRQVSVAFFHSGVSSKDKIAPLMKVHAFFATVFLLAVTSLSLNAQKTVEIKTDLVLPFFKAGRLMYEYAPCRKFSMEAGVAYIGGIEAYLIRDPHVPYSEEAWPETKLPAGVFILTVEGRYFPWPKHGADRFFVGCYTLVHLLSHKYPSDYNTYDYLDVLYDDSNRDLLHNNVLRTSLGTVVGYKWRFLKHFLFETSIGVDIDPLNDFYYSETEVRFKHNINGIFSAALGYRF